MVRRVLDAADARAAIERSWPEELDPDAPTVLLGIGKASVPMAEGACARLTRVRGIITAPPRWADRASVPPTVEVLPADHPLPTDRNVNAAMRIAHLAGAIRPEESVLGLVSGGGSAHLCLPADPLTLCDVRAITEGLLRSGAAISEINVVRSHIERLKGGGLARLCSPAPVRVLLISDVIGDHLHAIASGPFCPGPGTFADAVAVLERHGLHTAHPRVADHLRRGVRGEIPETPGPGDACFDGIGHRIIASNRTVLEALGGAAPTLGLAVEGVHFDDERDARTLGEWLAGEAIRARRAIGGPSCIVVGGEARVAVGAHPGVGGRAQEAALGAAIALEGHHGITIVCLATDGVDGNSDAAGAIVDAGTCGRVRDAGLDPRALLDGHDSHRALRASNDLVITGPTGTNVNDIAIAIVDPVC